MMWTTRDNIVLREIGEDAVLVPVGARVLDLNGLVTLNRTGRFVWELLDGNRTVEELAEVLARRFAVGREQARADVEEFLCELERLGLAFRNAAADRIQGPDAGAAR